jgi:proteasome lid subunit RPN8/RPN11
MLILAQAHLKTLTDMAEESFPAEACALLIGRRGLADHYRVHRIEPSPNVATDPRWRFEIDPGLQIGLARELRGGPDQIIGVWHSHPNGSHEPSATDAAMIFEPDLCWLITATLRGQALQTEAYAPAAGGGFRRLGLVVDTADLDH